MITEQALQFIETTLESKTEKQLTPSEEEIFKAARDNETDSSVTEIILWQSLCKVKDTITEEISRDVSHLDESN